MSTHPSTPGPYVIRPNNDGYRIWKETAELRSLLGEVWNDGHICEEHGGTALGNAYLLSAAPEMRDALAEAVTWMETYQRQARTGEILAASLAKARAALAAAEGRTMP